METKQGNPEREQPESFHTGWEADPEGNIGFKLLNQRFGSITEALGSIEDIEDTAEIKAELAEIQTVQQRLAYVQQIAAEFLEAQNGVADTDPSTEEYYRKAYVAYNALATEAQQELEKLLANFNESYNI